MSRDPVDTGALVRRLLRDAGLTCSEAARRLGYGVSTVSSWRSGTRRCKLDVLEQLAQACGYVMQVRFVRPVPTAFRGRGSVADGEPPLDSIWTDVFGRPWLRTVEGWAPALGNPLRLRLAWTQLVGLYGSTPPPDDVWPAVPTEGSVTTDR